MSDLVERLREQANRAADWWRGDDAATCTEAAARIQALETSLAEAEGRVISDVVAWLRNGAGYKEGHIGPGTIAHYEKLATALETGEWKK